MYYHLPQITFKTLVYLHSRMSDRMKLLHMIQICSGSYHVLQYLLIVHFELKNWYPKTNLK